MAKAPTQTCRDCSRTVRLIRAGGRMVAVDTEVIAVVMSGDCGEISAVGSVLTGRRVHSEMCESYQRAARQDKRGRRSTRGGL